jgi:hypothetical protein
MNIFQSLGQLTSLMRAMPRIQEEMDKFQRKLGDVIAEGAAGGDMVRVRVNGRMEIQACVLSEAAMALNDREMLEDLIVAATNQALTRVRELVAVEAQQMAGGLGVSLPPGMNLPGMS